MRWVAVTEVTPTTEAMKTATHTNANLGRTRPLGTIPAGYNRSIVLSLFLSLVAMTSLTRDVAFGQCVDQPAGLVAWWRGEGDAADGLGIHNGTLGGGITFAPGKVGQAFSFDGIDDYVSVPHSDDFNPTGPFSVELWIKALPSMLGGYFLVIDKSHGGADSTGWVIQGDPTGRLVFGFPYAFAQGTAVVADDQWHHVAGVYTGTQMELYIDGALHASEPLLGLPPTNSRDVMIGRWHGGGRHFGGLIDGPAYYNRALTAVEVQAIYNAGSAGKCAESTPRCAPAPSGLVGWWPGEGNVLDAQGDNDGFLVGGATYASGKVGQGFQLNGTDAVVEIPDDPSLQLTGPITVEAWINPAQVTVGTIASKYDSSILEPSWAFLIREGRLRFTVIGTDASTYRYADSADPVVATDVFSHVAATFDPVTQEIKIYVNGTSVLAPVGADSSVVPTLLASTAPVRLGMFIIFSGASAEWFNGLIDEFAMYDRVLSSTEIQAIYNAGGAGKCEENGENSILASADTVVTEHPALGGSSSLHGADSALYAIGSPGYRSYPLVAFDLSAFAGQSVVGSPRFEFWLQSGFPSGVSRPLSLHAVLIPWDQATTSLATFGGPLDINPGAVGAALSTELIAFSGADTGYRSWSIPASVVQSWIDNPLANFGILVQNNYVGVEQDLVFESREGTYAPRLVFATAPCEAPLITAQPTSQTVCPNTEVTFIVLATGSGLSYQWIKNGEDLLGETDAFLIINPVQAAHAGQYRVRVQNTCGVELSAIATLNVVDIPPAISLTGPASITVEACTGYSDPGASALDDCDGILPVSDDSNTVNASVPDVYVVTYSATDSSDQTTTATRTVTVQDTVAPEFVNVPEDLTLDCSDPDKETKIQNWLTSVTATDTCGTVTVENDFGALGACYTGSRIVKWTASDGHGNSVEVTRTLTITADGLLSELTFDASPLQITLSPDEQGQVTFQAVNAGECPILIQSGSVTGPEFGPLVTLPEDVLPLTLCPGDSLNLVLDVDTTDVVPGTEPYDYVLTLLGQNDDSIEVQLEVSVVEGGLPDLTANQPGGGLTVVHAGSPFPPGADEAFTLRATLFNIGTLDASEFKVRFFDGPELLGVVTVSGLVAGATTPVEWPVLLGRSEGFYQFRIQILPPRRRGGHAGQQRNVHARASGCVSTRHGYVGGAGQRAARVQCANLGLHHRDSGV